METVKKPMKTVVKVLLWIVGHCGNCPGVAGLQCHLLGL